MPNVTYASVALQFRMSLHHRVVGQAHRRLCFVTVYLSITPGMSLAHITVQIVGIFSGVIRLHCFTAQRVNRLHVYKTTPMACLWLYPAAFLVFFVFDILAVFGLMLGMLTNFCDVRLRGDVVFTVCYRFEVMHGCVTSSAPFDKMSYHFCTADSALPTNDKSA